MSIHARSWKFLLPAVLLAVGAGGLAVLNEATLDERTAQARRHTEAQLASVAPHHKGEWSSHASRAPGVARVYRAVAGEYKVCVLEVESEPAYNGTIRFLLGLDESGDEVSVIGARIVRHTETPGIGARIESASWLGGLINLRPSDQNIRTVNRGGSYAALTGATVSANALLASISDTLTLVRNGCDGIISA